LIDVDNLCGVRRLRMVTVLVPGVLVVGVVAAGCGGAGAGPATTTTVAAPRTTTPAVPPPDPVPATDGPCPYLDTQFVADTNGQHVSKVRLSADQPHPACFFYRGNDVEQLRVQIVVADPFVAKAAVDKAAPVATSDPATLPGGWDGGKQPTDTGAVFAVAKAGTAVIVITNQRQTIKASRIAEQAITALGF
jgi:hypothetical protein